MELWLKNAKTLEEQVFILLAWESAGRIGELVDTPKANFWGNILRVFKNKQKYPCKTCGVHKRSHKNIGKQGKQIKENSCENYIPHIPKEIPFKDLEISNRLKILLREYFKTNESENVLPHTDRYYRELCKRFHRDLTPHCFRRGFRIWFLSEGADRAQLIARLGQGDFQSLKHCTAHQNNEANELCRKIFEGIDTRKTLSVPYHTFKAD